MRRWLFGLLAVMLMTGCTPSKDSVQKGLAFRQQLLDSQGCEFDAVILADYTDCSYTFTLHCRTDKNGDLAFTVTDPESISDIKGTVSSAGGDLRFDETVLAFDTVADGLLSPVIAPWLCIRTLRGGYLQACETDGEETVLSIDDTFRSETLRIFVRMDSNNIPVSCEIYWGGQRYLSMDVRNFVFL